jgi:galactoside O-acetyltransferase
MNSFFSTEELKNIGFKSFGKDILISRYARFYSAEKIEIGNNVRIDDFCIISGDIKLGSNIHISAYCALYGKFGIEMEDYSGLSPRCTIFSATDDFSGEYLIGPMVNPEFIKICGAKVVMKKYSQLGSNCIVLPGVEIGEGVSVGAMSLVLKKLDEWKIYKGIPAEYYKERKKGLLKFI